MAKVDCSELAKAINDLASNIMAEPNVRNIDDVVAEMQKETPGITREMVTESIIEVTESRSRKTSEFVKKVNAIRREPFIEKRTKQKIDKLNKSLEEGKRAETPKQRKSGTETIERLRSTRNNLTKWLRNNNPTAEKRLKKKLEELNQKIDTGDIDPKRRPKLEFREPIKRLQAQINQARKKIVDARSIKNIEDQIDALNKHLEEGTLPESAKKDAFVSEQTRLAREIRDDIKKQIAKSEPAVKKRLQGQIKDLTARIESGDIQPKEKAVSVPQSKQLERLQFERDELQREIRQRLNDLKPRSFFDKAIQSPFNAARNIMTAFDFSAVFRQGGFIAVGHPVRAIKNLVPMFKAFSSKQRQDKIAKDIKDRPNAPLYAKSGLFIAPTDGSYQLSKQEEIMQSKLISSAEKALPGLAGSNRAYITFLNELRADSFDTMAAGLSKNGEVTQSEAEAIARYVNVATGRGNLGKFETAAEALNVAFFAPRYVASRFQLLGGLFTTPIKAIAGPNKRVHRQVLKEYARYLFGMTMVYALAGLAGEVFDFDIEFEWDPRSPDFGKIKIGNTRLDPLSGISQVTVLLSRVISGQVKSSVTGEISQIRGDDVGFGRRTTAGIIGSFLRYKLSPMFGTTLNILTGEDPIGRPFEIGDLPKNLLVPLSFKEIKDTLEEQGMAKGIILSTLAIFGMGVQTYGSTTQGKKKKNQPRAFKAKK